MRGGPHGLSVPLAAVRTPALTLAALVLGGLLAAIPATARWWHPFLLGALVLLGAPVVLRTLRGVVRGKFAADLVAMLAIATAILLREPVAGLVIVLMQTGGELLERYAEGRASEAVRDLEAAAPRIAHRLPPGDMVATGAVDDIAVDRIAIGDLLLVRPGEMLPCDGVVASGSSSLDTSRVTGEPLPERVAVGAAVRSGVVNLQSPFAMRSTAPASESLYARIVELVRTAQAQKSPIQRLADRWAVWFTPVTLAACVLAWWLSGDATRVLAVLVVATPCPLLLATPVAVIGGINRAARRQVIVRNGTALELLARVDTAVFDKTGTLTVGQPAVDRVNPADGANADDLLRLAAAVEVGSGHLLARTTVAAAAVKGLHLPRPQHVVEYPGRGASGEAEGNRITIGTESLVRELHPAQSAAIARAARGATRGLRAFVLIEPLDGGAVRSGTISYADQLRPGLRAFLARLAGLGIRRTLLLSGDHLANVEPVAREVGIGDARGDLLPEGKVEVVRALEREGHRVLMVGDGTNDAPALSAATVGIALAAHGGGISAEAAGVVLLADDVTRVEDAVRIGQRSVRIARQSIFAGLALSGAAMVVAALGYIPPTIGALLQEGIDVAVILNALRAARS